MNQTKMYNEPMTDFSVVLGGPLFQLLRRAHLADDALGLMRRRMLFAAVITWAPLLALALWEGLAVGRVHIPFLYDIDAHARFLVAMPLLIYAELAVHQRMRTIVRGFLDRKLIPEESMKKLEAALQSASNLRNSVVAEILLIAFVYGVGVMVISQSNILETATWYSSEAGKYTVTGQWYRFVSLPIFQFLLVRWYFRMFVWIRFLSQVSRVELNLMPTHPDRAGGLGFLSATVFGFAPLLMAHGTLLSGMMSNRILYMGARLPEFKLELFAMVCVLLILVLSPMLVFAPQLSRAKRKGLREYGVLGMEYVRSFDEKWLRGGASPDESFLGSGDIQSLADFGNSFGVIKEMRFFPFTKETILQLAIITLLPVLPLVFTMFSAEQLLDRFLGTVF